MSLFMAVMSCKRDQRNGCANWFRQQIPNCPIPYRMFLGDGCAAIQEDEVVVKCDDSYQCLPWKLQASLQWVLAQPENYEHIFKTDVDCHIWPENLLKFNYQPYDYCGDFFDGKQPILRAETYALGGGYVLSRRAAEMIVGANVEKTVEMHNYPPYDRSYAEDEFVGRVLNKMNRCHSELFATSMAGREYGGSRRGLIVHGNEWSTDRGRR